MLGTAGRLPHRFGRGHPVRRGVVLAAVWLIAGLLLELPLAAQISSGPREAPELYVLIRSRRYQEAVAAAEGYVKAGQQQAALEAIQWLLSQPSDVLIRDASGQFRSSRGEAERLLRSLPAAAREQYQRVNGSVAAGAWGRLPSPPSTAACLELVRSYFSTEAGYLASASLISRWLDDGNVDMAAALAMRVIDEPAHRARITPAFLRRAELSCRAAGRTNDADAIRTDWLSRVAEASTIPVPASPLAFVSPNSERGYQSLSAAAPLSRPVWQRSLDAAKLLPQLDEAWRQWSAEKRDKDLPTAVAWRPIVVGEQLIFRDLLTIRALDVQTGAPLWHFATKMGADQLLNPTPTDRAMARRLQWEYWESLFGSSLAGSLSTDGVRVYAVSDSESLLLSPRRAADARDFDDATLRPAANSLIALNVWTDDEAGRLAWSTADGAGQPEKPLAGHTFLGPPAIAGDIAFCLAESDRELVLAALDADSGQFLWRQPVALAERSLFEDRQRGLRAGIPTVWRGMVLCPSNVGLLVAVDAVTGQFRWYHSCLDPLPEGRPLPLRPTLPPAHKRHSAFAPLVYATGDRAVYMPTQSEFVYCLDVNTGRELWHSHQSDAQYLGGVTDDRVIVVGHGSCRALSLDTGEVQWTMRLDSVPAGTGVMLADGYLLPLDSGQVLALGLKHGLPLGASFSPERRPIGHLALASEVLVTVGGDGTAAYPQAGVTLRRIQSTVSAADDPLRSLDLADVYLAQGDLMRAVDALQTALAPSLMDPRRGHAERTLREVYFRLLVERPEKSAEWFQRLAPLCQTADQQARRWIALSHWHLKAGRRDEALDAGVKLSALVDNTLHPAPDQTGLAVSIPVWLATLERRAGGHSALASRFQSASRSTDVLSRRVAEFAFPETPLAHQARESLAQDDRDNGRYHAAEIRWLRNRQQSDRVAAARAALELAKLYEAAGLSARAAEQLQALATRFAHVEVEPGRSGAQIVRQWPAGTASREAWDRRQPVDWPIDYVQTQLVPRSDATVGDPTLKNDLFAWNDSAEGLYGDFQRLRSPPPQPDAPYEWMTRNYSTASSLMVFDKIAVRPLRFLTVPSGAVWPAKDMPAALGSSQTFCVPAEIRCVSMMQGGPDGLAWSASAAGWSARTSTPLCGPATPFGAVFQLRDELLVVDPADGRLLWKRDDLDASGGLYADSAMGLLADEHVLFALSGDRATYRLFDLATGQVLRQDRFERDPQNGPQAVGTLVYHLAETPGGRNIRVWDAAANKYLVDAPLRERMWAQVPGEKDLVWLTPEGRLRVFEIASRQVVVDCPLSAEELENVVSLKAFAQGGRYFINMGRNTGIARTENLHEFIRDPMLATMNFLSGEIVAFAPGRTSPLWRAVVPQRSFVLWGQTQAPVLTGVSIVKDKRDNQRRWLVVESLDPATGVRLGYSDQLPEMRLYSADYDGRRGVIRLVGEHADIELRFGRAVQQVRGPL